MMSFVQNEPDVNPEARLKFLLIKKTSGWEPGRDPIGLNASRLTGAGEDGEFCPRASALAGLVKPKVTDNYVTASLRLTFDIGNAVQAMIVNHFADLGMAVTDWKCLSCGTVHRFCKRPPRCKVCHCKAFKQREMRFTSAYSGASCGLDLGLDLGLGKLVPVEIKTIDKDEFKTLVAPLAEHRQRTALYLRIISESDEPAAKSFSTKQARVLYASKGGYGCKDPEPAQWGLYDKFSPYKEFILDRNDEITEAPTEKARQVHLFRKGEAGMPDGICPQSFCKRAKGCKVVKECWSGKFPAGMMMQPKEG